MDSAQRHSVFRSQLLDWYERSRRDLHLAQLLDSAPAMVEAVVVTLRTGHGQRVFEEQPQLQERARAHAETRQERLRFRVRASAADLASEHDGH